jgi:hypothetical protein
VPGIATPKFFRRPYVPPVIEFTFVTGVPERKVPALRGYRGALSINVAVHQ